MTNTENEKKAMELADEMHGLLEKWLGKSGPECDTAMDRVDKIKKEIHAFGFYVNWIAGMKLHPNPADNKFDVEVQISRPKPDMSPENQARYDAWFKKVNGLS